MNGLLIDSSLAEFFLIYDLRDPAAGPHAHRARQYWGRLYTDVYTLDNVHIILAFRSGGERWKPWEARRRERILGRVPDQEQAA